MDVLKIKYFVVNFLQPRLCVEASQTICSAELLVRGGAACASLQWSCCGCETVCLLKEDGTVGIDAVANEFLI